MLADLKRSLQPGASRVAALPVVMVAVRREAITAPAVPVGARPVRLRRVNGKLTIITEELTRRRVEKDEMGIEGFSAVAAMSALRAQLEDRLNQNEDYRALKALEVAIATITPPPEQAIAPTKAPDPVPVMPRVQPFQPVTTGSAPSSLMQRLSMHYGPVTRAKAIPAQNPTAETRGRTL